METDVKQNETITIRGKQVVLGRLTSSREAQIFFEHIAPAVGPLAGDVLDKLAPFFGVGGFATDKPLGLAVSMEKLVKALPWDTVQTLAKKVLDCSTYQGKSIWPQIDAVCVTALDWIKLLVAALQFLYSDFSEALGSLPFLKRRAEAASNSEGSTGSAGPSGA